MAIRITKAGEDRVRSAIESAEAKTSAEIFAVIAESSDDYRYTGAFFLSFWILVFSLLLALWANWQGHSVDIVLLVCAQMFAWLCGILLLQVFPELGIHMTPKRIKHRRSHLNAVKQFMAHGIHKTSGRNGMLVFVSLRERYGEILVDAAIEDLIPPEYWLKSVAVLVGHCSQEKITEGFEAVILGSCEELARHFPKNGNDENELGDKLVILH